MSAMLEFDTGPLNWVRGEIETALKGAAERVRAFDADPSLENAHRLAQDEAHMATGALQMVGFEGAAKVVASLEAVLAAMASKTVAADQLSSKAVLDALDNTLKWLARMAEGRGEGELVLFPSYRRLRELLGEKDVFEGDLFYPDLKIQAAGASNEVLGSEALQQRLKTIRAGFQRGLLAFLKNSNDPVGLSAMRSALGEAEACAPSPAARTCWWVCKGFINGLENNGLESGDPHIKQLLSRTDKLLRQSIESGFHADDQLLRDALFFVAKSQSAGEDTQAVRAAFSLDKYLPKQRMDPEQMARVRPVLKLLRETLTETRNHWHAYSEGSKEALAPFLDAIGRLLTQAGALNVPSLSELISGIKETAEVMGKLSGEQIAGAQLEIATTLLFLQNSVESEDVLEPDFHIRAESQTRRLAAAKAGHAEESASDLMDEGSIKAAEHALLAQLGQEIGTSLRQMEDSLDAFFRDPEARDNLASLDILSAQVQGAMAILEQSNAAELMQSAMSAIRPYLIAGTPSNEEKIKIADALSSLGLFVEAHCAGRQDAGRILQHARLAFGLEQIPAAAETISSRPVPEAQISAPPAPAGAEAPAATASPLDSLEFSLDEPTAAAPAAATPATASAVDEAAPAFDSLEFSLEEPAAAAPTEVPAADETVSALDSLEFNLDEVAAAAPVDASAAGEAVPALDSLEFSLEVPAAAAPAEVPAADETVSALDSLEFNLDEVAAAAPAEAPAADEAVPALDSLEFSLDEAAAVPSQETSEASAQPAAQEELDDSLLGLESYADYLARTAPEEAPAPEVSAEASTPIVPASVPAAPAEPDIDSEILEIFLEEAADVLNNMAAATDACEANPNDRDNLTVVRRAFHTLKGSGRMVGLTEFGEVAWGLEQMMNGWLAAEKPATKALLEIVRRAHALFSDWVPALGEAPGTVLDASALLADAAGIGHEQKKPAAVEPVAVEPVAVEPVAVEPVAVEPVAVEPVAVEPVAVEPVAVEPVAVEPVAVEPVAVEPVAVEPVAVEEEVQIGTVRLAAGLYEVYTAESGNWAQVLSEEIERLSHGGDAVVSALARRAAHTLAGISGTTGFVQLANLAHAVEAYIDRLDGRPVPRQALATLLDGFRRMNSMIENIHARVVPLQAAPLIYALNQLPAETPEQSAVMSTSEAAEEVLEVGLPETVPAAEEAPSVAVTEALPEITVVEEIAAAEAPEEIVIGLPEAEAPDQEIEELILPALTVESDMASEAPEAIAAEAIEEISIGLPEVAEISQEIASAEPSAAVTPASEEIELHNIVAQPAPKPAAPVFEERRIQDEIDPVLLPIFLEEAETLVPEASQALRDWIASPAGNAAPSALRRVLHTIKGSARMAGAMRLGELTHIMETQVISVLDGQATADAAVFEKLEERFDRLANAVDQLKYGPSEPEVAHVATEVSDTEVLMPSEAESAPAAAAPAAPEVAAPAAAIPQPAAAESMHRESATLRVRSDWVDRMVNEAGEVAIARSRVESEMHALKRQTAELAEALRRLKDHVREVEIQAESQMQATFQSQTGTEHFDPLEFDRFTRFQEVTRFLSESVHDIFTVQQSMASQLGEADAALLQQARMNRELQQNLLRVRMVPLYSVSERLYRVVRQTARDLNKRAQLDIQGGDIEIDRGVLEKIVAPIEHLLRNSIAHGLETSEGRAQANKPEFGEIKLIAKHEGNEMVLLVKDDGAGLNLDRIRQKALDRGLLSPGVEPSESQIAQLIFVAGFSTAEEVSQVAGRGVGMDVVKNEIAGLGGRVEVATKAGEGVTFTIYLPLTLAVTQAVNVIANKHEYALPATLVEQVQELKPEALAAAFQARAIEWRGNSYPLFYLPHLLGQPEALHEIQRYNTILLMRSGTSHAGILVDVIEGTREIVVKNIGPQVSRVTGIAGATVRGDGKVVLILNPVPLAMRALNAPIDVSQPIQQPAAVIEEEALPPLVMVVDDSLTVRKITTRLLLREGYRVESGKDGVDALEKMHDLIPDVVLLDVEMPRMDGFELARVMRNDEKLKKVPIIMITSRTADKHRNHALEIGVNVYLGKPYQEAVLLSHIAEQLGDRALTAV